MLFQSKSKGPFTLKPYLLRLKDSYLMGLEMDSAKGSPCSGCVLLWLKEKNVSAKRAELSDLPRSSEWVADLLVENSPNVFFEITEIGNFVRLDTVVFPNPRCICEKTQFVTAPDWKKDSNFAFSPITQLELVRHGTPDGNIWLAKAVGFSPLSRVEVRAKGSSRDREKARFNAVENWIKKAVHADMKFRLDRGDVFPSEVLQTGNVELITKHQLKSLTVEGLGIGRNKEEATLDALCQLSKSRTLKKYTASYKNPLLVVGANNWMRSKVPFFITEQYDLHMLFYPNSTQAWVVGLCAFSRLHTDEKPHFVFASHSNIQLAIDELFLKLIESIAEFQTDSKEVIEKKKDPMASKLNMWWTHWIYRCSKISLKDVLHLEPYPVSLESWREYFRDGQEQISVLSANHTSLPSQMRYVVKLQVSSAEAVAAPVNTIGIGTWSQFQDSFL